MPGLGAWLQKMLAHMELIGKTKLQSKCVVPQTCHCYHRGPNHTWTHPAGSSAKTDFIAIDRILLHEGIRTWVTEEIDVSLIRRDHERVMIDLPICISEREVQVSI